MPLTVEDGSGLSTAEAFISVSDADAYFTARGVTAWTGSTTVKEQALRRATDYMEARYGRAWLGSRRTQEQALAWPRYGVYNRDGYEVPQSSVPQRVRWANAELAMRALTSTLLPDQTATGIVSESVSIPGPISQSITYAGEKTTIPTFPAVDQMLQEYLIRTDYAERG